MSSEEKFDPLKSPVDHLTIPRLLDITTRARRALLKRSSDEVRNAQETVEGWIEAFFETTFEEEVSRLRRRAEEGDRYAMDFFHVERHVCGDHWDDHIYHIGSFNDRFRDDLDIPHEGNTTEAEALDACIDWFDLSETEFGEGSEPLFFSALALKHVERALWYVAQWMDPDDQWKAAHKVEVELYQITTKLIEANGEDPKKLPRPVNFLYRSACEAAIDAMEAVTYADKYSHANWLRKDLAKRYEKALSVAATEQEERRVAEELQARKDRSAKLLRNRHAKSAAAKALVLSEWEADTSRFASAESAGDHFSNWLTKIPGKNFHFAQRTVRDWIRARAAEIGVVWR